MKNTTKKWIKFIAWTSLLLVLLYGGGRLYYRMTGGFTEGNITYNLSYDPRWDTRSLPTDELNAIKNILSLKYKYLGKGCQSYVFESENGAYVLKFFKYQRFRPQPWLSHIAFLPGIEELLKKKIKAKREKLESVFSSWKIAYEDLQAESGVVYVHLNKSKNLDKTLILYDKLGLEHKLNMDDYEFMIQHKASLLCSTLTEWMSQHKIEQAKRLIYQLVYMLLSEYKRGYADNDHALMQNTGVLNNQPIHIDVGQFVKNNRVKNPLLYQQELFNKTWKFRKWLESHHPLLFQYLTSLLKEIMGEETFLSLKPYLNKADVGIISNED